MVDTIMQVRSQSAARTMPVMSRKIAWLLTVVVFTLYGLMSFLYRYLDDLAREHEHTFGIRLFEEMTGAYAGMALFPFLVWAVRAWRIRKDNWVRTAPLNVLLLLMFSVCDTALMGVSRSLMAPWFGLGRYDYGILAYRYPMEFAKHLPTFLLIAGGIYIVDAYREALGRQVTAADLEARLAEAQLQNLRLQLQPHFLFNALNTISSMMHEDVDRADGMLAQLSDLLRETLRAVHAQEITLGEELSLLRKYLAVMEGRFGEDLVVDFEVDPELHGAMVPQLILQPLVENSIRYARDPETFRLAVHIGAAREGARLLLQVRDQGPGIPQMREKSWQKGIGLKNTEERLHGLYGDAQAMELENAGGLTVSIRLPLRLGPAA